MKTPRPFAICACQEHAFVRLTLGFVALVDPEDVPLVSGYCWHAKKDWRTVYAFRRSERTSKWGIHREILGDQPGKMIDHINGNALDNRRKNLRHATPNENQWNRKVNKNSSSQFYGVQKHRDQWRASIATNGARKIIGYFEKEEEAARAYDKAAESLHGEFARINFPDQVA